MNVTFCWLANTGLMCGTPQENDTYNFVTVSPAVPYLSCLYYLDGLGDEKQVAAQQLFCGVLLTNAKYFPLT